MCVCSLALSLLLPKFLFRESFLLFIFPRFLTPSLIVWTSLAEIQGSLQP